MRSDLRVIRLTCNQTRCDGSEEVDNVGVLTKVGEHLQLWHESLQQKVIFVHSLEFFLERKVFQFWLWSPSEVGVLRKWSECSLSDALSVVKSGAVQIQLCMEACIHLQRAFCPVPIFIVTFFSNFNCIVCLMLCLFVCVYWHWSRLPSLAGISKSCCCICIIYRVPHGTKNDRPGDDRTLRRV